MTYLLPAVCDTGANAGTDVTTQGLRTAATWLSENHSLPEVAADDCPAG